MTRRERELVDAALRWLRLKRVAESLKSFAAETRSNDAEDALEKAVERVWDERKNAPS